jgi:hypothetical protein
MDEQELTYTIDMIKKIANNALCFDDAHDFGTALWQILNLCGVEAEDSSELELID